MKRKNLYLLMILLLLSAMALVACGGGNTTTEEPAPVEEAAPVEETAAEPTEAPMEEPTEAPMEEPTAEPTAVPTAEPTEEPISLTVWADDTRTPALQSVAAAFEEEFGVTVVIEQVGFGDIRDNFTVAGPAGEGPDIIVGAHDWLGELVSSGLLAPMDLGDKLADFNPSAIEAFTFNGELYGMPNAIENVAFFINADEVDGCPATWTDVLELSRARAADNTDNIDTNLYGFVRMEGDPFHFFPIQTAFGGYVFGLTDTGYNPEDVGIDNEGSLAAAAYWDTLVKEGLQPPAVDWDTMHVWFETGKSTMTITGPWALGRIRESGVNYAICDLPDETAEGQPFLGAQGFMVSAFSEDPLLAQIFLTEFVATPEAMFAMYEVDPRAPAFLPALALVDDPDLAAFASAGANALPMPAIPEMASVWDAWGNAVVLVAQQAEAPDAAFINAAEQIRTAIAGG